MNVNDEQVTRVIKTVTRIMFKHQSIFPIVKPIVLYAGKLKGDDLEFYVRETLASRIGMYDIVRYKLSGLNELWWSLKTSQMEDAKIAVTKSVLTTYLKGYDSREDGIKFRKIKDTELTW